jgi:xylitol oxidase
MSRLTNWAGNITFSAERVHSPTSVDELQRVVATSRHIRALGSGHSFNTLSDSRHDLVSLARMPPLMEIDSERSTVTVGGGVRYGDLSRYLHREGYALHNLASLPHISVAGACATGTHGSGVANGNLATAVRGFELVTASGDLATLSRDSRDASDGMDADFRGSVVALGALGVVHSMTLDIVPTFDVAQRVYEDLPLEQLYDHLDETLSAAYSVSLFTDWRAPVINQMWAKRRVDQPDRSAALPHWITARPAHSARHPVPGMSATSCTEQLGVPGPWHERLPHFRLDFMPSTGDELQSEYLVPRESAAEALAAVSAVRHLIAPLLLICELRMIAADELWLSPSYQRDSFALHFTWVNDIEAVSPVVAAIEDQLAPFAARPHWGKVFSTPAEVIGQLYDRLDDFRALALRYDPAGKFRNDFIDRYLLFTARNERAPQT